MISHSCRERNSIQDRFKGQSKDFDIAPISSSSAHFTGTTGAIGLHGFELQGFCLLQRSGRCPLAKHANVQYLMVKLGFPGHTTLLVTQVPLTQTLKRTVKCKSLYFPQAADINVIFKEYPSLQTKLHFSIL